MLRREAEERFILDFVLQICSTPPHNVRSCWVEPLANCSIHALASESSSSAQNPLSLPIAFGSSLTIEDWIPSSLSNWLSTLSDDCTAGCACGLD